MSDQLPVPFTRLLGEHAQADLERWIGRPVDEWTMFDRTAVEDLSEALLKIRRDSQDETDLARRAELEKVFHKFVDRGELTG